MNLEVVNFLLLGEALPHLSRELSRRPVDFKDLFFIFLIFSRKKNLKFLKIP